MKTVLTGCLAAFAIFAGATPSYAASHFSEPGYVRTDVRLDASGMNLGKSQVVSSSARLNSEDDRNWQLTLGNCALNITSGDSNQTSDDARFAKSYAAGFAGNNPSHQELNYLGRAQVAHPVLLSPNNTLVCDARRIYWVTIVRIPKLPGVVGLSVLSLDGYKLQTTEMEVAIFRSGTFMKGQDKPVSALGDVTAAIAKTLRK